MEIVNVIYAGQGKVEQDYSIKDKSLIQSNYINSLFGDPNDKIEVFIYDVNGSLIDSNYEFKDYTPYQTINSETNKFDRILIDPVENAKSRGFNRGSLNIQYNFFKNLFNSSDITRYWIKDISPSRTELRLSSQTISDTSIISGYNQYQAYISLKNYFSDFYLNFGNNEQLIAINAAIETTDEGNFLLIKLYEPLPFDYDIKTQLWLIDKLSDSVSYNVDIEIEASVASTQTFLRGPNFSIIANQKNTQTTPYYSYNSLISSPITSSYRQLASYYQDKAVSINVDYTDFSNFIHFSSATERVNNFVYKLGMIEDYTEQIISQSSIIGNYNKTSISSSITNLQNSISNIVTNFDTYEYYLFYSSQSFSWPKYNSTIPYKNVSITSSQASNWLGSAITVPSQYTSSLLYSASLYDDTNKDLLRTTVPQFIQDDSTNQQYLTFIDMMGQHFDNIWIYYKDVSNRYNSTNDPNTGISIDVVSDALKGMGFQLYTNTNVSNNVYYDLFGYNEDGSLLPPTGSEIIKTYVTSSLPTGSVGSKQTQQEIYKRLYHNLPYLYKTRGTQRGIKALLSIYGIPNDILTINEFGEYSRYSVDGIDAINNQKIRISTSSLAISSSVLSPFTSIQYYTNDSRLNSTNIEVGFSTADILNDNITSSLGYFSMDNLIGNPALQYSSSYTPLVSASNSYFAAYTQPHSVWEYIRLIKYFNNSLFKTIKDFVPARANISTGIVVKSHILERNKYARHEPSMSFQDYSQSIDMVEIYGEPGNMISGSTNWEKSLVTIVGLVPYSSSQNVEKLTGEFDGTIITATSGKQLSQLEISKNASATSGSLITVDYGAIYQNISMSVRSLKLFDLDYTANQLIPVNFGLITQSISNSISNNYETYTNPNNPYAYVQDYNYVSRHFTDPRYYGCKVESKYYNTWSYGDNSYGKTAAIDKKVPFFAYLVDIYTASFNLNGRSNSQIKYIIDNNQNILDLTKANNNIFYTQNIFKSGLGTIISLFDYDPRNPDVQSLTNRPTVEVYEGGFRYSPMLFRIDGNEAMTYSLQIPQVESVSVPVPSRVDLGSSDNGYVLTWPSAQVYKYPNASYGIPLIGITGSGTVGGTTISAANPLYVEMRVQNQNTTANGVVRAGTSHAYTRSFSELRSIGPGLSGDVLKFNTNKPDSYGWLVGDVADIYIDSEYYYGPGGSSDSSYYITTGSDSAANACLFAINSNTIKLTYSQSYWYQRGSFIQSGSYPGMETPSFPLELNQGDMLKLYNLTSSWIESEEYTIDSSYTNDLGDGSGSLVYMTLNRDLNPQFTQVFPAPLCRYIINKHLPDETNVILRYSPRANITQDGLLFPQYIDPITKDQSGNIVKSLRAQNALPPG